MNKSVLKFITVLMGFFILSAPLVAQSPVTYCKNNKSTILSAEVWSDNFDDKDISDWQLFCVNSTAPDPLRPGNSSAAERVLRHNGTLRAFAGYNSSIAFGTWSFDVDVQKPEGDDEIIIAFMSEKWNYDWPVYGEVGEAYVFVFYIWASYHEVRIAKTSHENGISYLDSETNTTYFGWQNVIITRALDGYFYVYMNGEPTLEGANLQHTTSERFYFISFGGPAIDNVSVSNTIDYDKVPPRWIQAPTDQQREIGVPFYYDLNATDSSNIDNWWIDDLENFAIDENGVITNTTALAIGNYLVNVWVNDTHGFTQHDSFTLSVLPSTSTTETETRTTDEQELIPLELIGVASGIVIVVLALIIWRSKK